MRHDDQINELKFRGMAKLSDEQLKLVKWRLEHGETITGRELKPVTECQVMTSLQSKMSWQVGLSMTTQSLRSRTLRDEFLPAGRDDFVTLSQGAVDDVDVWILCELQVLRGCQ